MKKILLLGGSAQQVIAIETAKKLGYYTVLCDFLTDNPGQYAADKFYLVSTTDKDAVLEAVEIDIVPLFIPAHQITGVEPASPEGGLVRLEVTQVALSRYSRAASPRPCSASTRRSR